MVLPGGVVQPSTKNKKGKQLSKKQKARADKGRDRAVERSSVLAEKERQREERKVSVVCGARSAVRGVCCVVRAQSVRRGGEVWTRKAGRKSVESEDDSRGSGERDGPVLRDSAVVPAEGEDMLLC
jgi:hypothetical protein